MASKRPALAPLDANTRPVPPTPDSNWVPTSAQPCKRIRIQSSAPTASERDGEVGGPAVILVSTPCLPETTLSVLGATTEACTRFADQLMSGTGPRNGNQSLPPVVRPLTNDDLLFPQHVPHGHCSALWTRTLANGVQREALKLKEGGTNNDAPRSSNLDGVGGKVYIYHVLAVAHAAAHPSESLNLELLSIVSQGKQEDGALTILHLCGHKWCMNPRHFAVGTKRYNDEQVHCHRGLQAAESEEDIAHVRAGYCRHSVKCWSIVYRGPFQDEHQWA